MIDGHQAVFEELESQVRYYCRRVPNLFRSARGAIVRDATGVGFIDFLSGCGSLNYGHNHPHLIAAAIHHLTTGGILAGLDFHTEAKLDFLSKFAGSILVPRGMSYRMQFPGPTGANCVEAAIKLARKVTGRNDIVAFTNAFHGVSLGALALTGSRSSRDASSHLLNGVIRVAYDGYCGAGIDELRRFEAMATDPSGGIDPIAAFIVETVQGEGGLNVATSEWLRALASVAKRIGALLIVDDIQAGCGRAGGFFSFERADLYPDMVCLAKSISGAGFPMSLLLLKPELDVWAPGEHNGTFRGNTLAFATASAALDLWDDDFQRGVAIRANILERWCDDMEMLLPEGNRSWHRDDARAFVL